LSTKTSKLKVGFFGDSWCGCSTKNKQIYDISWPNLLTKKLNAEPLYTCLPGGHLFHAYEKLENHLNEVDYAIIVVSDPYRLPSEYQIPAMSAGYDDEVAERLLGKRQADMFGKYVEYHYRFFSRKYSGIAQKGLLSEIDNMVKDKKALIIPGFKLSMQGYKITNAAYTNCTLHSIKRKRFDKNKTIANHLNEEENIVLANALYDFITSDYKKGEFDLKKYFKYLYN